MGPLLKIIGGLWALVGVWKIIKISWDLSGGQKYYTGFNELVPVDHFAMWTGTAMVNMLMFILPGLAVAGLGVLVSRKRSNES